MNQQYLLAKNEKSFQKQKKFQQEKFKNFFGKPDRDKTIPIPGLESIPKPGDKIYSQKLFRKRIFSNEVDEQNESPNKLSKFSDQSKPKSVSTIRRMFEQSVTEQQPRHIDQSEASIFKGGKGSVNKLSREGKVFAWLMVRF